MPGRHTAHTCSRAHARAHRDGAVITRLPRVRPRTPPRPEHPRTQLTRQAGRAVPGSSHGGRQTGRDGETGRTAAPAQPTATRGTWTLPPPRPTPPGAPPLPHPLRIHPGTHARSHARVPGPRPSPQPLSPARLLPAGSLGGLTLPKHTLSSAAELAPQGPRPRRRGGCGRWGSQSGRAAFSPPAPTSRGAGGCRGRGRRAEGRR